MFEILLYYDLQKAHEIKFSMDDSTSACFKDLRKEERPGAVAMTAEGIQCRPFQRICLADPGNIRNPGERLMSPQAGANVFLIDCFGEMVRFCRNISVFTVSIFRE